MKSLILNLRAKSLRQFSAKSFNPEQIVDALDKHIIGQAEAKRGKQL